MSAHCVGEFSNEPKSIDNGKIEGIESLRRREKKKKRVRERERERERKKMGGGNYVHKHFEG